MRTPNTRGARHSIVSPFALAVVLSSAIAAAGCGNSRFGSGSQEPSRDAAGKNDGDGNGKPGGGGTANETNQGSLGDKDVKKEGDQVGTPGSPGTPGSTNPDEAVSAQERAAIEAAIKKVEEACAKGKIEKKPFNLEFKATNGDENTLCQKTAGKDLSDHIRDFNVQTAMLDLPAGALVCGSRISSPTARWKYDDEIVLTMNGVVLLTSQKRYLRDGDKDRMARVGGGYAFDWDTLAKANFKNDHAKPEERYCYGGSRAVSCEIPVTQEEGAVKLDLPTKALAPLALKAHEDKKFEFKLWVTGDNEPKIDCKHSGITLGGEVEYVVVP